MLALILYTGCYCNYELCRTQRNGDYVTWKWFDKCLWDAISKLNKAENGSYKTYSGLSRVKLNKKQMTNCFFVTYTSTSWSKEQATKFMKNNPGMMIEIDQFYRNEPGIHCNCCDVSWISLFPDECEILFA
eukprot:516174_1